MPAISPPIERWTPDRGGNPWLPSIQARTGTNSHGGKRGLHDGVDLGVKVVKIRTPWRGMGYTSPAFPRLWDDWVSPAIKPRLSYAINNWSSMAHRSAVTGVHAAGDMTFQQTGHPPFEPQDRGLMDPVAAGRGYSRALYNPYAMPVIPAGVPLVKQGRVRNTNRRGGTGYVMPNPLARIQWPLYVNENMPT